MFVVIIVFEVQAAAAAQFHQALQTQARNSLTNEARCRVFDVVVDSQRDNVFYLYECYDTAEDFDAHLKTPHFIEFNNYAQPLTLNKTIYTGQQTPARDE